MILLLGFKRLRMDQKKTKKKKKNEQELIERLLGTNDCGQEGIGVMAIGSSFYIGEKRFFSNDNNNN